jgi:hypothetical protein
MFWMGGFPFIWHWPASLIKEFFGNRLLLMMPERGELARADSWQQVAGGRWKSSLMAAWGDALDRFLLL